MKKNMKKALLSMLIASATVSASAATLLLSNPTNANAASDTDVFQMVDGAAIRMSNPKGLRFIAQLGTEQYKDLKTIEPGVIKKMGMFIMPFSYIDTDGNTLIDESFVDNYHTVTTKINHVFYSSDNTVENKLYKYTDKDSTETYYRANGVITNLYLHNYDTEFIGIAYIAETDANTGVTTYSYTDLCYENNVRSAAYVAVEAYSDYDGITAVTGIFNEYIDGAHVYTQGVTETVTKDEETGKRTVTYTYGDNTYTSIAALKAALENCQYSVTLDKSFAYVKEGSNVQLTATLKDVDNNITFDSAHVSWESSDESIVKVDADGNITSVGKGTAVVTARFANATATCEVISQAITFDNMTSVPSYLRGDRTTLSISEMNGGKVLNAQTTAESTSDVGVHINTAFLGQIFADENVDYMAFDLKSGADKVGTTVYYHDQGATKWTQYETTTVYHNDELPLDSFKTYYFPRSVYQSWVDAGKSSARFIMIGGSLVCGGESFYIDNIRPATEEERSADLLSFEYGGFRDNDATPLFVPANTTTWDTHFGNATSYGFTSEIVSDGNRAVQITKAAGDSAFTFCHTADGTIETAMRNAGYATVDIYAPADSDGAFKQGSFTRPLNKGGWTTVYLQIDSTSNEWARITDTTGGTYVIDNIRLITEEEYLEAKYGFETGVLRTNLVNDASTASGQAIYYFGGSYSAGDAYKSKGTLYIPEGNGSGDGNAVSNARYESEITHSGNTSLAFDKGSGYMYFTWGGETENKTAFANGFTFWMYSTTAIDGTSGNAFVNNGNTLFNDGNGIYIPANTWTQIMVTTNDFAGGRFLIMQGSWTSTIYLDDFAPLSGETATVTYNANGGTQIGATQTVVVGEPFNTPTPSSFRDFLGWKDENGNFYAVGESVVATQDLTLTAVYGNVVSFEDGVVPSYMSKAGTTELLEVVDMSTTDGGKALRIKSNTNTSATTAERSPALTVTLDFLASFFADESVDYIAFDAKTGSTKTSNFRRVTLRANGTFAADPYEEDMANGKSGAEYVAYNGISADAFKTFYFTRADYNAWVNQDVTSSNFIATGNFEQGDSIYIDNIRAATQAEHDASTLALEGGNVRLNDGNNRLFYMPWNNGGQWGWRIAPGTALTASGYTNEIVSDGIRAYSFTPVANTTTSIRFNTNAVTNFQTMLKETTGIFAFDLYVPEDSDATLTYSNATKWQGSGTIVKGNWTTIYVKNSTTFVQIKDTTGSTYVIDNFRSVTEEEYNAAGFSFEANTGAIRTESINADGQDVFYYYNNNYGGGDYTNGKYSFAFLGNAANDILTDAWLDSSVIHGGDYSLAFQKTNGYMSVQFNKNEGQSTYPTLSANGFTFWIYSTVGLNGTTATNFVDGSGAKFGENGITVPANKWTQVTVLPENINSNGRFLIIQGNTAGTIYIDDIEVLLEQESLTYNATENDDGSVLLMASSHNEMNTSGTALADIPTNNTATVEDMSYIKMGGTYGLNDFLVFDFTGNNMPILSFFNSVVDKTIWNQEQDENVKGWIVTNGMTTQGKGLLLGGSDNAHANRLTLVGPYKISYKYDDNGSNQAVTQIRTSEGSVASPSPISMASLLFSDHQYRMIIGWVANGTDKMNLQIYVQDLTSGVKVVEYNLDRSIPVAEEGDIALYGHFGRETLVDYIHGVEENTTLAAVVEKYMPALVVYKGEWSENGSLTLAESTKTGTANKPTTSDMSYIAFNGDYGFGDYVVFDFTGNNVPLVSFFNNQITNTAFNTAKDTSVKGWVWANGLYTYGSGTVHYQRTALIGAHKIACYDDNTNDFRTNFFKDGSTSNNGVSQISIDALTGVTDTYRMIIGMDAVANNAKRAILKVHVINMVTGAVVYNQSTTISKQDSNGADLLDPADFTEGSIILYGQFGKTTVLDRVFGVEENTTMDALKAKYAKDVDYSDEAAVELDRYGYSSINDGTYKVDSTTYHHHKNSDGTITACSSTTCTAEKVDFRKDDAQYDLYREAGFNIILAQTAINVSDGDTAWQNYGLPFMNLAAQNELKVILWDYQIASLSMPLKAGSKGAEVATSSYQPWVIQTDIVKLYGEDAWATDYDTTAYNSLTSDQKTAVLTAIGNKHFGGITPVIRFSNRQGIDNFMYDQLVLYKDHEAFYGVQLGDEPAYYNAYCYGEVYKALKRVMPEIYVQYNLLPLEENLSTVKYRYPGLSSKSSATNAELVTAYKDYVELFLDAMDTDYIQYDNYPFKSAEEGILFWTESVPYVDNPTLKNIQMIAEIAKERDLAVKVVTQSCVMTNGGVTAIRQINENDARWLNNYLLGFGVKQINYFTYWTKANNSTSGESFLDGGSFVNRDGSTTAVYDFMKKIMAENTAFAPTISHFDYVGSKIVSGSNNSSFDSAHITWTTMSSNSFKWLTGVTVDTEAALVTELYDATKYNYMYMLMNTIDPNYDTQGQETAQVITITFDSTYIKGFYVYENGVRWDEPITETEYEFELAAGQAVYLIPYC